jgi:hypothetical protein
LGSVLKTEKEKHAMLDDDEGYRGKAGRELMNNEFCP